MTEIDEPKFSDKSLNENNKGMILKIKDKNEIESDEIKNLIENEKKETVENVTKDLSQVLLTQTELDQILINSPNYIQKLIKNHYLNNLDNPETLNEIKDFLSDKVAEYRSKEGGLNKLEKCDSPEVKNIGSSLDYTLSRLGTDNVQLHTFGSTELYATFPKSINSDFDRKNSEGAYKWQKSQENLKIKPEISKNDICQHKIDWYEIRHPILPFSEPKWGVKMIFNFYDVLKTDFMGNISKSDKILNKKKENFNNKETTDIFSGIETS